MLPTRGIKGRDSDSAMAGKKENAGPQWNTGGRIKDEG